MTELKRVCLIPSYSGVGGPASFQVRFIREAARQGVEVCTDLDDQPYDAVLVIGGTRQGRLHYQNSMSHKKWIFGKL